MGALVRAAPPTRCKSQKGCLSVWRSTEVVAHCKTRAQMVMPTRSPRAARNTLLNHRHTIGTAHHPPLEQQSLHLPLHLPLHRSCLKESRKENNEPVRKCTTADGLEIIGVFKVSLVPVPKVGFFGGAGCSIYPPGNEFIKNLGRHTWIKITGSWPLDA